MKTSYTFPWKPTKISPLHIETDLALPKFWEKKKLSMCAQRRFTICPKYVILAPSSQKKYKLAYEIQNINALSLLPSCLKNNYNNL